MGIGGEGRQGASTRSQKTLRQTDADHGSLGRFPRRNSNPPRQTMSLISLDFPLVLNPGVLAGARRQEEAVRRKAEETGPQCLQESPP